MYSRTKNWITICRINGIHPFVIAVNFVFYALILLFLPLENRKYAKFRKLVTVYYPQIRIDRPKLFDPLRIVVQTLYILLFVFERSDGPLPFVRHAKYLINLFTALFFRPAQILTARIVNTYGRLVKEKQPAVRTDSNAGGPVFESITVNLILMLLSLGLTLLFVTQPLSLTYQFIFMGIIWLIAVLINSVRNRISLIIMIFMSIMIA
jgi:cellulose synthase (UDP-forming)